MMPDPQLNSLRDSALEYAEAYGWRIFPLGVRAKIPAIAKRDGGNGHLDGTTDQTKIAQWWAYNRYYNIGLATGRESGVWVLDLDGPTAEARLAELIANHGGLPATVEVTTGRADGGRHMYFRYPTVGELHSRKDTICSKFETKGDGGYVVVPPSVHPTGAIYQWSPGRAPWDIAFAEAPAWLIDLFTAPPAQKKNETAPAPTVSDHSDAYGRAAIDAECRELATCAEGARNDTLNRVSYRAGQLVGGGLVAESDARSAVLSAAQQCGLGDVEAKKTYDSGYNSGLQSPAEKKERRDNVIPLGGRDRPDAHDDDDGITAECTDLFSAETLIRYHGDDLRFCDPMGGYQVYDGCRWSRDETGIAAQKMKDVSRVELKKTIKQYKVLSRQFADMSADENTDPVKLKKIKAELSTVSARIAWWRKSQNQNRIKAALDSASTEREISTVSDDYDADHMSINVANGTIDLHTGTLRPHDRGDLITRLAPVVYDPTAEAPLWDAFLRRIFADKNEEIASLRRLLGYCLTGSAAEEVLPIYYGTGANGKSTLRAVIEKIMGDYYRSIDPEILLDSKVQSAKIDAEKANLKGARLATCVETTEGRTLSDGLLKQVASRDPIVGRHLYYDPIVFAPTHKVILITNHRPRVRTTDLGTWRRLLLVPFNVEIPEPERDQNLDTKLASESSGILNWLVAGCAEWQQIGLAPCDVWRQATNKYKNDEDALGEFVIDCCIVEAGGRDDSSGLYKAYEKWCSDAGERPRSQTAFGRAMVERGFERIKSHGRKVYVGIRLRSTPCQSEMVS